jgi:SAM-dependent methyltransferase
VSSAEGRTYALGHSERELERLRVQASLIEPITRRFFVDAGIGAGMRVLDVGSGAGDVAFLVAELVGETGKVVGVDRVPAPLITARQRARARAVTNVSFLDGDPTEMSFDQRFDAVVGRYVLMYQPDPSATIRTLVTHLRPGAVVVFHEPYRDGIRSFPPVPSYDRAWQLVDETLRRTGGDTTMGIKLHAAFVGAGLAPPSMRLESIRSRRSFPRWSDWGSPPPMRSTLRPWPSASSPRRSRPRASSSGVPRSPPGLEFSRQAYA